MKFLVDKTNFIAGEVGERYLGNARQEDYNSGCALLKNFFPLKNGGVIRRPGTQRVFTRADVDASRDYRIIPYTVSEYISNVPVGPGDTVGLLFSSVKGIEPSPLFAPVPVFTQDMGKVISESEGSQAFRLERIIIPSNETVVGGMYGTQNNYTFSNLSNEYPSTGDQNRANAIGRTAEDLARVKVDEIDWVQVGLDLYISHRDFQGMRVRFRSGFLRTDGSISAIFDIELNAQRSSPISVPRRRTNNLKDGEPSGTIFATTNEFLFGDTAFADDRTDANLNVPAWNKNAVIVGFAQRHRGAAIEGAVPVIESGRYAESSEDNVGIFEGELVTPILRTGLLDRTIPAVPDDPDSKPFSFRFLDNNLAMTKSIYFELEGETKLSDPASRQKRGFLFRGENRGATGLFHRNVFPLNLFSNPRLFAGDTPAEFRDNPVSTASPLAFFAYTTPRAGGDGFSSSTFSQYPDFDFEAYFLRGRTQRLDGAYVLDAMRLWLNLVISKDLDVRASDYKRPLDVSEIVFGLYGFNRNLFADKGNPVEIISKPSALCLTAPFWFVDEWFDRDNPRIVGTYQQRLVYGSSKNAPDSLWLSGLGLQKLDKFVDRHFPQDATGDTSGVDYPGEVNIDDPFSLRVYSNVLDEIRWLNDEENLILGMSGSAKSVQGFDDGQLGAGSTKISTVSNYSSSRSKAVRAGDMIYFISADGKKLRSIGYSVQGQRLRAVDVTVRNDVLIKDDEFKEVVFCESRNMLFLLTKAGKLFSYTILENAPVGAWARHELGTGGLETQIQSISVLPNVADEWDDLWLVVKRGSEIKLEVLGRDYIRPDMNTSSVKDISPLERITSLEPSPEFAKALAPYYMDSSVLLTYLYRPPRAVRESGELPPEARDGVFNGTASVPPGELRGLFNGKSLGSVKLVQRDDGSYTLDPPQVVRVSPEFSLINELIVGYDFESELETTPVSLVVREGTAQASPARMDTVTFRLDQSLSASVGVRTRSVEGDVSEQALELTNYKRIRTLNGVTRAFSGLELLRVVGDQAEDQRIFVKVNGPYPFSLLSLTMRGVVND